MKNFTKRKLFNIKWQTILLGILFLFLKHEIQAQHISNNGAYISISNGTEVRLDIISNDAITKVSNEGVITINTLNNPGVIQGNGRYNIAGNFTSTGTFFSNNGAVNMNGTLPQTMALALSNFNNLIINNAVGVTLNSTETKVNNLTINSGKIFKIEADKNLIVTGNIVNSGGNEGLILKSTNSGTAALIHNTDNVPATVQRYISGAAEDFHFLSAPVSDQSISGVWNPTGTYGNGTGYDLYIFHEPTPCWTYQLNSSVAPTWTSIHTSSNFIKGRGYLYATQATNPTKEFVGLLNNGNVSYPITNDSPDPIVKGFNLIGNPYPSSIDWKSNTGWNRDDLILSAGGYDMWIFNPASNNYGVYNSLGDAGTNGVTQFIPPTQGYFVRAASNGNITTSNAVRVNNGASNWLKTGRTKKKKIEINRLKIRIGSNDGNGFDEVLIEFGYPQNEAGALKLFSRNEAAPSAYLNDLNKDLSIRYLTNTNENSKVPLHFKAGKDGDFSLSIDTESLPFNILLLEDKKTKIISDLKVNSKYEFKGSISDAADRFVLHFTDISLNPSTLPALIYYDGNEINVDLTSIDEKTNIKVFDMLGRLLINKKRQGKMVHRFNINPKKAVYIVVASSKGKSVSRIVLVY